MTTCILLLICFTATIVSAFENSTVSEQNLTAIAYKTENTTLNPNEMCTIECIQEAASPFVQIFKNDPISKASTTNLFDFLDLSFKFCEVYNQVDKCLEKCPDDPIKRTFIENAGPMKYVCVEKFKDFKKHLSCMVSNKDEIQKTCGPKCEVKEKLVIDDYKNLFNRSTHENLTINEINEIMAQPMEKTFSDSCTNYGCQLDCSYPLISANCSKEAAVLVKEYTKRISQSIENTIKITNKESGIKMQFPKSCKDLQNGVGVIKISILLLFGMILVFVMKRM